MIEVAQGNSKKSSLSGVHRGRTYVRKRKSSHEPPLPPQTLDRQTDNIYLKKNIREKSRNSESSHPSLLDRLNVDKSSVDPSAPAKPSYRKAWELLSGRSITYSVLSPRPVYFDGTEKTVEKIVRRPKCPKTDRHGKQKPGIFITKQSCSLDGPLGASYDAVTEFTTIVIECDDGSSMDEQKRRIIDSGIPFSIMNWSGSKSLHTWIILNEPVLQEKLREINDTLLVAFPKADQSVIKNLNSYARFPIEQEPYSQTLIDVRDKVELVDLERWIAKNAKSKLDSWHEAVKTDHSPSHKTQKKLEGFVLNNGGGTRFECPVCEKRGRDSQKTLSIKPNDEGRLLFNCFRCRNSNNDRSDLKKFFIAKESAPSDGSDKSPNQILDEMYSVLRSELAYVGTNRSWYRREDFILQPLDQVEVERRFWSEFEQRSRKHGNKLKTSDLKEISKLLAKKLFVLPKAPAIDAIPLSDGYTIDIRDSSKVTKLADFASYCVPITIGDWQRDHHTPVWNNFLDAHASKADQILLMQFLGYIFSGFPVERQQCMLILKGPSDSGKSVLTQFIGDALGIHATSASVSRVLTSNVFAATIINKRVAISSEASLKARDSEKFRALISGEDVNAKILWEGEYSVRHNCIFVGAANEGGFLENVPENRKRIRVVSWDNPIARDQMDFDLLSKLKSESTGIIVDALRTFAALGGRLIPATESTGKFMEEAGRNANAVADWLYTIGIKKGDTFNRSKDLYAAYRRDTEDRFMKPNDFGRRMAKALGTESNTKKTFGGREHRGFYLSGEVE